MRDWNDPSHDVKQCAIGIVVVESDKQLRKLAYEMMVAALDNPIDIDIQLEDGTFPKSSFDLLRLGLKKSNYEQIKQTGQRKTIGLDGNVVNLLVSVEKDEHDNPGWHLSTCWMTPEGQRQLPDEKAKYICDAFNSEAEWNEVKGTGMMPGVRHFFQFIGSS